MDIYKKIEDANGITRYSKNNIFISKERIPASVMEKFDYTDSVKYDSQPGEPRCLFCDAPRTRKRQVMLKMVELCDHHYYSQSLGSIVAKLRTIKQGESDGINAKVQKRSSTKRVKRQSIKG